MIHDRKKIKTGELLRTLPASPIALSEQAEKIYLEEGAKLILNRLLKASDLLTLAQYANEAATYFQCSEEANKGPLVVELHNKVTAPNHYRKLAETALKNMLALADRLGMSPRSRQALKGFVAFREVEDEF